MSFRSIHHLLREWEQGALWDWAQQNQSRLNRYLDIRAWIEFTLANHNRRRRLIRRRLRRYRSAAISEREWCEANSVSGDYWRGYLLGLGRAMEVIERTNTELEAELIAEKDVQKPNDFDMQNGKKPSKTQ